MNKYERKIIEGKCLMLLGFLGLFMCLVFLYML